MHFIWRQFAMTPNILIYLKIKIWKSKKLEKIIKRKPCISSLDPYADIYFI